MAPRFSILALTAFAVAQAVVRYDGHRVLRVFPHDSKQIATLHGLEETETFDFWTSARVVDTPVDIHCSPDTCDSLLQTLDEHRITDHSWMIENLQQDLDDMLPQNVSASADFALNEYHTIEEIQAYVVSLATQYSDICEYVKIGTSYQGREMGAIKITGRNGARGKKSFWMNGGIHAREWISPATTLYMLTKTLEGYGSDTTVTSIVDSLNIYYAPVVNPDGYAYTWSTKRLHRKTMMPNNCFFNLSPGTDPNRNFDYMWGQSGSSSNPCSETYRGESPADQPEIKAIQDVICGQEDFLGYIDIHSYSQLWLSPWGYTSSLPADYSVQMAAMKVSVDALQAVHGTSYTYGPSSTTIYVTSGGSNDYTYAACGTLFSFCLELRDTGRHGFVLPPDQIIPSGEETFEGVKALAQYMIAYDATVVV